MATFSVLILTAAPPGQAGDGGGAFAKIDGREALLRTVELFLNRDNVKQIQLAIAPEAMEEVKRKFGGHLGFSGVKLVSGGPKWMDQIAAAAPTLLPEATNVIIHDAARPAVPYSDIDAIMTEVAKHPVAVLATPLRTTLAELDEGGNPVAVHLPGQYMQLMTPMGFSREKFAEMARTKAEIHPSQITLVKGSALNVRINAPGDSGLVNAMIKMLPKPKIKALNSPFEEAQW